MKNCPVILFLLLILNPLVNLRAQIAIPKGYFSSPLNIGLSVTGSFSEVRPNHFHSGVDFPVQKKEGLPVFAVADGVVSRIKVSPVGFGNALYIDHPNGFTSVYAHLKGYNDTITAYLHTNQYKLKSFEVDLFPANRKDLILVKKGQLIGYAGNSGSSFGAHLHFELRNTKTEHIINPLLFGFNIADNYPPYIDFIKIYPENENSFIGSVSDNVQFKLAKTGSGDYRLASKDTISLWGKFSFGVQAFDFHHSQSDRNGFYSLKMLLDNADFFSMVCDSFSFSETRYVNASLDFASNYNSGDRIVKSKKLPGSQLSFIKTDSNDGIVTFNDDKIHEVLITVGDLDGNKTNLRFWVKSQKPMGLVQVPVIPVADTTIHLNYDKVNCFTTRDVKIDFPAGSLYENLNFRYRKAAAASGMYSDIHYLHSADIPVHNRIKVSVNASKLPQNLRSKALLVRIDREGKRSSAGGGYENGYVTASTNMFDGYAIVIDTIAPTIKPYSENSKSKSSLRFTVSDNFSGIETYRGEVNGQWALVEWDPKNKLMVYKFDQTTETGKNTFKLYLEDEKGNSTTYSTSFSK